MRPEDFFKTRTRELLRQQKKTQSFVARKIRMNGSTFRDQLNIRKRMPIYFLNKLAEELGVSVDFLLGRTDDHSRAHITSIPDEKDAFILRKRVNTANVIGYEHRMIATKTNIPVTKLRNYLNHDITIPPTALVALADFFGVSTDFLSGAEVTKGGDKREQEAFRFQAG